MQCQRWRWLEEAACTLEILTVISLVIFSFVLMQLPRYVNLSTCSTSSPSMKSEQTASRQVE